MNWIDYIILGVLGLSVLVGLWRGLVSEVLALAVWVAAFWVAWLLGPAVSAHFDHIIELPSARIAAGYGLCFVAVLILGALLRFVVHKLVESTGLSGTDRLLGMLFGFARGVLLVSLMVFLVGFTAFTRDPWWQQSALLPQFQRVAAWLGQQVPPGVRDHLQPQAMLAPLHSQAVLDPLHPQAVLAPLHSLSEALRPPMSGHAPAPAATVSSTNHP